MNLIQKKVYNATATGIVRKIIRKEKGMWNNQKKIEGEYYSRSILVGGLAHGFSEQLPYNAWYALCDLVFYIFTLESRYKENIEKLELLNQRYTSIGKT